MKNNFKNTFNSAKSVVHLYMPTLNHTTETLDASGKRTKIERNFTVKAKSQPFISIPFPVSPCVHKLTSGKDFRVLFALAELAEFNTNTVFLVASRRQQVMGLAQVSSAQLSTSLKRLRAAQILSGAKGEATIHPTVMWKGDSATKKEKLAALAGEVKSDFDN